MSAAAAFLALAAAAQAPTPAPLFAAFKAVCARVGAPDGFDQRARNAGWSATSEAQADPRIASIVAKARDAAKRAEPGATVSGMLYRQDIDGRTAWLAVSRVAFTRDGRRVGATGCRVYDLDAPVAPSRQAIDAWVGSAPTTVAANGTATKRVWEPWQAGTSLEITYVPRGHPLGSSYGIQGLVLVSQSIGGF